MYDHSFKSINAFLETLPDYYFWFIKVAWELSLVFQSMTIYHIFEANHVFYEQILICKVTIDVQ